LIVTNALTAQGSSGDWIVVVQEGRTRMQQGGCLCGAVRYEVRETPTSVAYCHCSMCRKWHGHVGGYAGTPREQLSLLEQRGLKWFASSPNVRRGFCGECGASLFFDDAGEAIIAFCPGTLDEPTGLHSTAHIYVASKGDYYEIADDGLVRFNGAPRRIG
jgi:hypothetical protein